MMVVVVEKEVDVGSNFLLSFGKVFIGTFFPLEKWGGHTLFPKGNRLSHQNRKQIRLFVKLLIHNILRLHSLD
jgi:hypothetical protein